jgi:uncharacterized membrane protein YbhN (UPF0104 family)
MKFLSTIIIRIAVLTFAFFIIKKIFNDIDLLNFSSIFTLNNIFLILIAAFSLLSSVIIRSIRWRYLVYSKTNKINKYEAYEDFWNYLFSLVLNLIIPFRSGEIFRVLSSGGHNKSLIKNSLSAFIEKSFDILVLGGGLGIYILFFSDIFSQTINSIFIKIIFLIIFLVVIFILLFQLNNFRNTNNNIIKKIKNSLNVLTQPKFSLVIFLLTVLAWSLELVKFVVAWYVLGNSFSLAIPLLAFFLATFSMGLPGAPAAIGTFHYAIIVASIPFGIEYADALNYAVLTHILYFTALVMFSFLAYFLRGMPSGLRDVTFYDIYNKIKSRGFS